MVAGLGAADEIRERVLRFPETLHARITGAPRTSARGRAARSHSLAAVDLVGRMELIALDDTVLDGAADLPIAALRALDAIHLAADRSLGSTLEVLVTYDARMAVGPEQLGMRVVSPR